MAYPRCAANLVIDNAHHLGRLLTETDAHVGGLGIGRDWNAMEPKDDVSGFTPDVAGQYSWYYADVFEYIDRMRAIAPIRAFTRADMTEAAWALQGKWRLGGKAANSQYRPLEFYDARPGLYGLGEWGKATSVTSNLGPNLQFWVWRHGRAKDETDDCLFAIHLRPATGIEYAICFPGQQAAGQYHQDLTGITDAQQATPYIIGKPANESKWSLVTRRESGAGATVGAVGKETKLEVIRIEYDDGFVVIRSGERDKGWVFGGKWQTNEGREQTFALTAGTVEVRVLGHTAAFAMAALTAPTGKVLYPHKYHIVDQYTNPTPQYKSISSLPAGTSLAIAADALPSDPLWTRPAITFNCAGGSRPLLYCVQEYRAATIGDVGSNPVDSFGADAFQLERVSGRIGEKWRGSTLDADVTAKAGWDLLWIKPNGAIACNVQATGAAVRMFTGYVPPPEQDVEPGARLGQTSIAKTANKVTAADIIEARLAKKQMFFHCSYEGWTEGDAFAHILNRAGVPASLISVSASCTKTLPSSPNKGNRKFKFAPDCEVIAALDTIAKAYWRRWGVDQTGTIFLAPQLVHTAGTYDYTLDYDTDQVEDIATRIRSSRTYGDFRNLLLVMVGEGNQAAAKLLVDWASLTDSTADNFIADLWGKFVAFPDGTDVNAIAAELWAQLAFWQHHVEWTMLDRPAIMPDEYVRMQVATSTVPLNSIFRIISKAWECRKDGRFSQTLQAVRVE